MTAAWREGTHKQYSSFIKQWRTFCCARKENDLEAKVEVVLEFLSYLFHDKNLGFSAINTARSALSSYLVLGDGTQTIGTHPLISKFMRGVFNMRPPAPRYKEIWDVRIVLSYLRKLSPANSLTLKQLTLKLVVLMALTSAQRVQTLQKLRLDEAKVSDNCAVFYVNEPIKQSRPGSTGCKIKFPAYPPDRRLCTVKYIKRYIELTSSIRASEQTFFISYCKPHHKVTNQTLARWIKDILKKAGLNIEQFKAHSTRAASTSAASRMDVPIDHILETAGWKSEQTFSKFYKKPLQEHRQFAESVLDAAAK